MHLIAAKTELEDSNAAQASSRLQARGDSVGASPNLT
jgi:hypothetical protein